MAALEKADVERYPWERQPGESPQAYGAFQQYRDAGLQRSIRKLALAGVKDRKRLGRWSSQWGWVNRAELYDLMLERERIASRVEGVKEMEKRHAQLAEATLSILAMPVIALGRLRATDIEGSPGVDRLTELERMPTGDLLRLAAHTSRSMARLSSVERVARGAGQDEELPPTAASSPVEPLPEEARLRAMFEAFAESGIMVEGTFKIGTQEREVGLDGLPIIDAEPIALEPPPAEP